MNCDDFTDYICHWKYSSLFSNQVIESLKFNYQGKEKNNNIHFHKVVEGKSIEKIIFCVSFLSKTMYTAYGKVSKIKKIVCKRKMLVFAHCHVHVNK